MSKALSVDLQDRALTAVAGGLSLRAAGERFGVSAASVSRWRTLERSQGDARPKALDGDRRSGRVEACKPFILSLLSETSDITVEEIRRSLAERGHMLGFGITAHILLGRFEIREGRNAGRWGNVYDGAALLCGVITLSLTAEREQRLPP